MGCLSTILLLTARHSFFQSPALSAANRLYQLWWAGGENCWHAPRAGGKAPLGVRTALFACAELLHGAARARGVATGHLPGLADAPDLRRDACRRIVCAAFATAADGAELGLHGVWLATAGHRYFLRYQARCCRHHLARAAPQCQQIPWQSPRATPAMGDRGGKLCGDLGT